jgi:hypothetical protein
MTTETLELDFPEDEPEDLDEDALEPGGLPTFPTFADVTHDPLPIEWNWEGRIPRGHVVLMAGFREVAKGLLGWSVIGAVTNGLLLPGEEGDPERIAAGLSPKEPGDVIGVWAEDDANEDNAWRARASGTDLGRVHDASILLPGGTPFELSAARGDMGNIPELLGYIRQLRTAGRNPRLVVLDPLDNLVMNGTIQSPQGATRLMKRLEFVARRTGVTVLVVHHLRPQGKDGKVGGSSKVVDVPRWVYTLKPDEDAPELMVMHREKGNQGKPADLRYRIVRDGHASRIEWVPAEDVRAEGMSWRSQAPGQSRILAALKSAGPAGLPLAKLQEVTRIDPDSLRVMLSKLKAAGLAVNPERGVWRTRLAVVPDASGYGVVAEQPQVTALQAVNR